MSPPKVSILIPCHNAEEYLAESLSSALGQTWSNKEIILVDDGSTDNSLAIAKEFESPSVKIITQENRGQSGAQNRALQEAQGDFIQYLDADDLLAPEKVERQMKLLLDNPNHVAAGEWARFYKSHTEAQFIPEPVWADMEPVDWIVCCYEGGGMMPLHAWLFPRSIVDRIGAWVDRLARAANCDFHYSSRAILASEGVRFCHGAKCFYRSGITSGMSQTKSPLVWEATLHCHEYTTERLLAKEDSPRTRHACATHLQRYIYAAYPDASDLVRKAERIVEGLGGADLKPGGGKTFQVITRVVGWKATRRIQKFSHRFR